MGKMFGGSSAKTSLYKAGEAQVTISSVGDAIFLQVQVSIGRQLSPIATLGQGIHWAAQPPQGQLTAQSIVTGSSALVNKLAGDSCDPLTLTINMKDAVCGKGKTASSKPITIDDGYCSQVGFSMSGQQGYIGSDITIMFTSCSM